LVWIFGGVGVGCSSTRTAGKGTTTTAILDPSLPATAVDFYKGWSVTVGNGSTTVTAYDPAMKMLTLAAPLSGTRRWTSYLLSLPPHPPKQGRTVPFRAGYGGRGPPPRPPARHSTEPGLGVLDPRRGPRDVRGTRPERHVGPRCQNQELDADDAWSDSRLAARVIRARYFDGLRQRRRRLCPVRGLPLHGRRRAIIGRHLGLSTL